MAQIFLQNSSDGWAVTPLPVEAIALSGSRPTEVAAVSGAMHRPRILPEIHRSECAGKEVWALLIPEDCRIWVNGRRASQMRVLRHRDSIWWAGSDAAYFSTEKLAEVEIFAGHAERLDCPRCKRPFAEGDRIVVCPNCSTTHHMSPADGRNCWTYSPRCTACPYETEMSDELRWTPEVA